jgi:hypothetical protein
MIAISFFKKIYDSNKNKSNEELLEIFSKKLSNIKESIFSSYETPQDKTPQKKRKLAKDIVYKKIKHDFVDYDKLLDDLHFKYIEDTNFSMDQTLKDFEFFEFLSDPNNPLLSLLGAAQSSKPVFVLKSSSKKKSNNSNPFANNGKNTLDEFRTLCNYDTTDTNSEDYYKPNRRRKSKNY